MKIIGLAGAAGSGKDTSFGMMRDWAGGRSIALRRDAFADRLKKSAAACFGVTAQDPIEFCDGLKQPGVFVSIQQLEYSDKPPRDVGVRVSGRQFLQNYGTEAHRSVFDPDFWVKALFSAYDGKMAHLLPDVLVLTDVRFPNEANAIHARKGEVWRVERPLANSDNGGLDGHVSEKPLPEGMIDRFIMNDGSLHDLELEVRRTCLDAQLTEAVPYA